MDTEATIQTDGRLTLPRATRQALGLTEKSRLRFEATSGVITVKVANVADIHDLETNHFLDLVLHDLISDPASVEPLRTKLRHLVGYGSKSEELDAPAARLYAHPIFFLQANRLFKPAADRAVTLEKIEETMAELRFLLLEQIPTNPFRPEFKLGSRRNADSWFKVSFMQGRFDLFYRAHLGASGIIYAWIADRNAARADAMQEPHVLFDCIATIAADGRTHMPLAIRRLLGVNLGGQLSFRNEGNIVIVAGKTQPTYRLAIPPPARTASRQQAPRKWPLHNLGTA